MKARTSTALPCRGFQTIDTLARAIIIALLLVGAFGSQPARADTPPTWLDLKLDKTLTSRYTYWFSAPDQPASAPRPLPAPDAQGIAVLPLPAAFNKPGAQLIVLDTPHDRLARLAIHSKGPVLEPRLALGPNLLRNAGFEKGSEEWTASLDKGSAKATLQFPETAALPAGVPGKVARFQITAIDRQNYYVSLFQDSLEIGDNEPVLVNFWARADHNRPLYVGAQVAEGDFHNIGLGATVGLGTDWRKYALAFTPNRASKGKNRLIFVLGDATGTVDLAGFSAQQSHPSSAPGINLITNGDFAQPSRSWEVSVNNGNVQCTLDYPNDAVPPPGVAGKVGRYTISAVDGVNWHVEGITGPFDLQAKETYTLSFWARADRSRPIFVAVQGWGGDFPLLGISAAPQLTRIWQKFTYTFQPAQALKDQNRVVFSLGDSTGAVEMAGVSLHQGQPGPDAGTNLLKNGDFSQGGQGWTPELYLESAQAALEFPATLSPPTGVAGKVAHVTITRQGKNPWDVHLRQDNLNLTDGEPYTLAFWARADHDRPITLSGETAQGSFGIYTQFALRPEWHLYTLVFIPQLTGGVGKTLKFFLAEAPGTVDLAGMTLLPGIWAVPESLDVDQSLAAADFKVAQTVRVFVKELGRAGSRPARDVLVTLQSQNQPLGKYQIKAADRGVAKFNAIPIGAPLTVRVSSGPYLSECSRTLSADAVGVLKEIDVDWRAEAGRGADNRHPLVGVWEGEANASGYKVRFTFNVDGTGTMLEGNPLPPPGAPPQGPVNAFRWYVKKGSHQVMVGDQEYIWAIRGNKLILTDFDGKIRTLTRL